MAKSVLFPIGSTPRVIIFALLFLLGFALVIIGVVFVILGIWHRRPLYVVLALFVPLAYWGALFLLWQADQRFIEEETRKNGGVLPDWAD